MEQRWACLPVFHTLNRNDCIFVITGTLGEDFFFSTVKFYNILQRGWFDYTKLKQIPHPDQSHYLPSVSSLWKLIRESTEQWTWVKCLWGEVAHFMKTMNFECKIILAENNYHTIHCHLYNHIVNIQINNFFRTK